MKPKLKKRKCKACERLFQQERPLQYVCCFGCSIDYQNTLRANKKAKEWRDEKKIMKEKLLTHKDYIQLFQKVFNTYIRKRDEGKPCISCDTIANVKYDAGHYFPTTYGFLRFHEDNVHRQCSNNCNLHKSGNFPEYTPRLIERIGQERVDWLHANRHKTEKLSIPEIKDKIKEYKLKIKELK